MQHKYETSTCALIEDVSVSGEAEEEPCWCFALRHTPCGFFVLQVHQLDEQTWRTVEVVPIDIANNEEVAQGVSDAAV